MRSEAKTVKQYLAELPEERRRAMSAMRRTILENLPKGYEEGMGYGMISYHVPHSVYPPGYHCNPEQPVPFAGLASQKNHMALYMMCVYADPELEAWFRQAWGKSGKKLDMGKSCVRFKRLDDVPQEVVGAAIRKVPVAKFLAFYETAIKPPAAGGKRAKKVSTRTTRKKTATRTTRKKAAKRSSTASRKKTGSARKK